MIHPSDEQSLGRLLGRNQIPPGVLAECELRTQWFHGDGNSGPLQTMALIELLRFLGYKPQASAQAVTKVDWRAYQQDGTVRVEAVWSGKWTGGYFLGFVESGTLAVRLDGDKCVREFSSDRVRLARDDAADRLSLVSEGVNKDHGQEPPRAASVDKQDPVETRVTREKKTPRQPPTQAPEVDADTEKGDVLGPPVKEPFDWNSARSGDTIWAPVNDDLADAKFVGYNATSGQVSYTVDGDDEVHACEVSKATYVAA